jgi:uncharacterized protein YceK
MKRTCWTILLLWTLILLFSGCGSYYKVTDPSSSNVYYTTKIDKERRGSVEFKDANTGSTVTLQNSEITEISKDEFKANTEKK